MSYYYDNDYTRELQRQQAVEFQRQQRAIEVSRRVGQLELAIYGMEQFAEQARRDAQHQAYLDNLKRIQTRATAANVPATPTAPAAPEVIDGNSHFHPSHLRRPQPVQSISDPLVHSVGANIRMGK